MVAGGTLLSAFWILSVNSWMQTPAGFGVGKDGRLFPTDYWKVIFNPSVFVRVPHMVLASYLIVAFIIGGVVRFVLRTAVLNDALEDAFRHRYPGFRSANDGQVLSAAA